MGTMANIVDPDEMPENAYNEAFQQGLHHLLAQNHSSKKEIQYFWKL